MRRVLNKHYLSEWRRGVEVREEAEQGDYNGCKTSTDADWCGCCCTLDCFPVSRDDAGGISLVSHQDCSQQPRKEPSIKASCVLSEPIQSVKKAVGRQGAAVMLRTDQARVPGEGSQSWDHLHLKCILDDGVPAQPALLGRAMLQTVWKSEMSKAAKASFHSTIVFLWGQTSQPPVTANP